MLQTTFTTEFGYGPLIPKGFPIHLEGKFIAILGMNGSGKTSLLNALFHRNMRETVREKTQVCLIDATSRNMAALVQLNGKTLEQYNDKLIKDIEKSNNRKRHVSKSGELVNLLLNHNDFTKQVQKLNDYLKYLGLPEYMIQELSHSFSMPQLRNLSGAEQSVIPVLAALTDETIKMVLIDNFYALSGSLFQGQLRDLFYNVAEKKQIVVASNSGTFINGKDFPSHYFLSRENDALHILRVSSKEHLERLISTGRKPVKALAETMQSGMVSSNRTKVFISYSHKDTKYLNELLPHLSNLEKNKLIDLWSDTKISPGDNWREAIEGALASTKIAILLLSIDFLNSPFIADNELPPLLAAAETKGVKILPVVLRPCDLPRSISKFQAVNNPSRPVTAMKRTEREALWAKLAAMIRELQTKQEHVQSAELNVTNNQQVHSLHEEKAEMPAEDKLMRTSQPQLTLYPHFEDRVLYHLVALTGYRPLPLGSGVSEADLATCLANELGISPDFPRDPQFHTSEARGIVLAAVTTLEQEGLLEAIKVFGPWTIRPTLAGRRSVEQRNGTRQENQLTTQSISVGSSPDFKILTSPIFQTNAQNWIDVNASEQRIEIKNIGKENAYHICAALFGCETYIEPNTMPQKRIDLYDFHWREHSGCPLEPRDTLTLTLMRYRDKLDGKQELGGYQLYAPQEPSLYDAMHNPSLPFHSARLTLTYRDRFGNKYAQTFDYDHNKKAWVYLAYPRTVVEDFFDLLNR